MTSLVLNVTERTPSEFFDDLAKKDFATTCCKFEVSGYKSGSGVDYKVNEWSKGLLSFLWISFPATKEQETADNLVGMVKKYAKEVVKNHDIRIINSNLQKIALKTSEDDTVQKTYQEAIKVLNKGVFEKDLDIFKTNLNGRTRKETITNKEFFTKLERNGRFRSFNEKLDIRRPKGEAFAIYTSAKPWSFMKKLSRSGKITPDAAKVATAENLKALISEFSPSIVNDRRNVHGMIVNLESMKAKITRNTLPDNKTRIEKAFNSAISELKKAGHLIKRDKSRDWLPTTIRGIKTVYKHSKPLVPGIAMGAAAYYIGSGLELSSSTQVAAVGAAVLLARPALNYIVKPLANKALIGTQALAGSAASGAASRTKALVGSAASGTARVAVRGTKVLAGLAAVGTVRGTKALASGIFTGTKVTVLVGLKGMVYLGSKVFKS